ncbi:MAG TPA: hypothetical protein VM687_14575 [Stenotrophomonas sp.]|nr:hypothetical protein [Stenotrophomonas sp.]
MSAPRWSTFVVALVLGLVGLAARLGYLAWLEPVSFGLLALGYLLLTLGVLVPRL